MSASFPPNALASLAQVQGLVGLSPRGLITDVDGTISEIDWPPERAVVSDFCRRSLQRLLSGYDLVATMSGRSVLDTRRMIDLDGLTYVGHHGLEEMCGGRLYLAAAARRAATVLPDLAALLEHRLGDVPGLYLERKTCSLAIHFRSSANPLAAHAAVLAVLGREVDPTIFCLIEGRKVVEVRPRARVHKGTALRRLIRRHGLKTVIYLGDDVTDVDAFRAIRQLRQERTVDGLGIVVASGETPPEVMTSADLSLDGIQQVEAFLESLVQFSCL